MVHASSCICCRDAQHDDQKVKDYGVKLAVAMIQRLTREAKVPGVHFCTLNLEKSVRRVVEGLKWTATDATLKIRNRLIAVSCHRAMSGGSH